MTNDSSSDAAPAWRPDFSEAVERALAKWPNVPACHGWLMLDRRGRWRLGDGPITHPGAVAFLNAHYASDEHGAWYVQNGPQRAWVDLELAPWILSVEPDGSLRTQTCETLTATGEIYLTEHGDVLLATPRGLAAVSDRDLEAFARLFRTDDGSEVLERLAGLAPGAVLELRDRAGRPRRVTAGNEDELLARHRVQRRPRP
ncbi:MAG TPA: DUF2946 family protein [Gammaproteobacteria bacterium]|nr:DUF2946 family protein [Gammaproteobacteria bacterium]